VFNPDCIQKLFWQDSRMKKSLAYALLFSLVLPVTARDFKPLLNVETLPVLAAPDFTAPLETYPGSASSGRT
jgi:hypothetical protein